MTVGIGMIGSGFIGKVHALAYRAAPAVFGFEAPRLEIVADIDQPTAAAAAEMMGFRRSTGDWRDIVHAPEVDVVDITAPNDLHESMALAAIAAGKSVYCEKPLAPSGVGAARMAAAAEQAGVKTMVGFNYLKNPVTALAKEIIAGGEIGEVFAYRGWHYEDYMHDPGTLINPWRLDPAQGDGVTSDLGSHAVSMARYLVGDIVEVAGVRSTVVRSRDTASGASVEVEVPDTVAALVRFGNGATGSIEASWMAAGRKHTIAAEVWGTRGSLAFDFERLNELRLYRSGQPKGREGTTTILTGPSHPDFGAFVPAPGHQLGFNDLKTIEVRDLILGLDPASEGPWPDFAEGLAVQRTLDALIESDVQRAWVPVVG